MPEFTHHRSIAGDAGHPPFIDQPPARTLHREDWTCGRCGRHLATIDGRIATLPGGTTFALPNAIRCHRCKKTNRKE